MGGILTLQGAGAAGKVLPPDQISANLIRWGDPRLMSPGTLASHTGVAQDHRFDAHLGGQIRRIDAAMRGRDGGAPARVGWKHGHAVENEWGHSCRVNPAGNMTGLRARDVLPSGRFLRRVETCQSLLRKPRSRNRQA